MADQLYYVYGIAPASLTPVGAPSGIDESRVAVIGGGEIVALVSMLDATAYDPNVDERVADIAWLGPRASAHDRVLTWASDAGAVVPLPIFSLFRSEDAVRTMLADRGPELVSILARVARGREYGVRIFRLDDELRSQLATYSETIASLEADVKGAPSPGQGYLLSRKLDAAKKEELQRVASTVANRAYQILASKSLEAVQEPLPKASAQQVGSAILNAAFLVAHEHIDEFREAVTVFVREHERRGFRVEFTGPWPPYHFTRATVHAG
jgi:hypothetical protein